MAYIWECCNQNTRYVLARDENISPYMEVWETGGPVVPVNPFQGRILALLFPGGLTGREADALLNRYQSDPRYEDIVNLLLHFRARLDRMRGVDSLALRMMCELKEIRRGAYGAELRDRFEQIAHEKAWTVLACLAEYHRSEQRRDFYEETVRGCFSRTRAYYEKQSGTLYIYIDEERTRDRENLFWVIEFLFKNIGIKTDIMWKREHFGIIGAGDTMRIGFTALI